ncbi:hypothetical protein SAMN04488109_4631 [Chryseolinea serpens]|uniref:Uncharacterized protein n=1 Tax=Chryseolinea serpens TaxID=947013 RepID=A0A1M5UEH0_9BACT|nr:hypothetical protein [Chryseolinea serpens]SHH61359.1 hypothetical protein SAMN04488109_4631 [Chryseolinea serpens]
MKTDKINIDTFETPLGVIRLDISSTVSLNTITISQTNSMKLVDTPNYHIEVIPFSNIKGWMRNTEFPVDDSKGWIFRITKKNSNVEQLKINCELVSTDSGITSTPDSGEDLDAIWIENKTHVLSIGTEDGERLKCRASHDDLMPKRLEKELGYQPKSSSFTNSSFTNYLEREFEISVPELKTDERIYFHYLVATKSKEYSMEGDISTNLAVDFAKWTLLETLGLNEWANKASLGDS